MRPTIYKSAPRWFTGVNTPWQRSSCLRYEQVSVLKYEILWTQFYLSTLLSSNARVLLEKRVGYQEIVSCLIPFPVLLKLEYPIPISDTYWNPLHCIRGKKEESVSLVCLFNYLMGWMDTCREYNMVATWKLPRKWLKSIIIWCNIT